MNVVINLNKKLGSFKYSYKDGILNFIILDSNNKVDISNSKARIIFIDSSFNYYIYNLESLNKNFTLNIKESEIKSGFYVCQIELEDKINSRRYSPKFEIEIIKSK